MKNHKFNYRWELKDLNNVPKNNYKVFSCFSGGGGSSMGYKLAGFDVVGCNEIDPKMMEVYILNLKPKHHYLGDIKQFKNIYKLPTELYELDLLDGSPPCSSFSIAGNREKDWGKEKVFREGQKEQILDTLFFDFIDVAKTLQPKIVIAENVKGLIMGEAKSYVREIIYQFEQAGYLVDFQLLNASEMGVPQRRERVFFYAIRKDLLKHINTIDLFGKQPQLNLEFNEQPIKFKEYKDEKGVDMSHTERGKLMMQRKPGDLTLSDINERINGKISGFNATIVYDDKVCPTIPSGEYMWRFYDGHMLTNNDYILSSSFPINYNFGDQKPKYVLGMSVPPVMMAQIATKIKEQWLDKF
jgi:DNA (cytosine-5)-methyltransferase 1